VILSEKVCGDDGEDKSGARASSSTLSWELVEEGPLLDFDAESGVLLSSPFCTIDVDAVGNLTPQNQAEVVETYPNWQVPLALDPPQ
jgi:hypothetical protein